MIEILGIALAIILIAPIFKESKYSGVERMHAMRRAMLKLQQKYRRYSL